MGQDQTPIDASQLPTNWQEFLGGYRADSWHSLQQFLRAEREKHTVVPLADKVFTAFHLTPPEDVRVVILGQDPYHGEGEAHGLSFSVPFGVTRPRSVINIHRELQRDNLVDEPPKHGNLESWARQGVLLMNTILTTRLDTPNAHKGQCWEAFTDHVIKTISRESRHTVFVLWGGAARKKLKLIEHPCDRVVEAAHPTSRANAKLPFIKSGSFSRTNALLQKNGQDPIDWASITRDVAPA